MQQANPAAGPAAWSEAEVEATLAAIEAAVARGEPVDAQASGFWRAVAAVKRNPAWVARYADRIGAIDHALYDRALKVAIPERTGLALFVGATVAGLALVMLAPGLSHPWPVPVFLAGSAVLLGTSHDLAHYIVGRAVGLRFHGWYAGRFPLPQPGLKIDYATYLRTPPLARAWMHASGALVTKVLPFLLAGLGAIFGLPPAAGWILLALGLLQVLTDLTFGLRFSDWKRFRRELRVARALRMSPPTA